LLFGLIELIDLQQNDFQVVMLLQLAPFSKLIVELSTEKFLFEDSNTGVQQSRLDLVLKHFQP